MADDALDDVDFDELDLPPTSGASAGGEPDSGAGAPSKKKSAGGVAGAPHLALRIVLGTAGLLLVVGFFLPWLRLPDVQGLESVSGFSLVTDESRAVREVVGDGTQRWLLLAIPGFGLVLTAIGFLGFRWSGPVGAVVGILLLGYGMFTVLVFFFQKTGAGMWLVLGGTFLSVVAGAVSWARSRQAKQPKLSSKAGSAAATTIPD